MDIILASTSPYRRRLLERLQVDFRCEAPDTDETPLPGEAPEPLARRLALAKAQSVSNDYPESLVIGSDQVASLDRQVIGKPGCFEAAFRQLQASSGRAVAFYTGLALTCTVQGLERVIVEPYQVQFRALTDQQIKNYLKKEEPYDCAGSFKAEGLGIALFEAMHGNDPSSLEGLPLIALTGLLSRENISIL